MDDRVASAARFCLRTSRLVLVQTPLHVLETRLQCQGTFTAAVAFPDETIEVTFPAEWPGDALVFFPTLLALYRRAPEDIPWGGTVIEPDEGVAVGQIGFKHAPEHGAVEIGYNISASHRNRGYATEIVEALTTWALAQPSVNRVTAECQADNEGSIGVLEKTGFQRSGEYVDEEEGLMILWKRTIGALQNRREPSSPPTSSPCPSSGAISTYL